MKVPRSVSSDNRSCYSEAAKYRPMQHPERSALALAAMLQTRPVRFLIPSRAPVPSCRQKDRRAAHISARVDELADPRFQSEVA